MAPQRHHSLQDKKSANESPGSEASTGPVGLLWFGCVPAMHHAHLLQESCVAGNELRCQSECVLQQLRPAAATSLTNPLVTAAPVFLAAATVIMPPVTAVPVRAGP